jgi:hypothetical protein
MMLSRLITLMAGISEISIRALPPFERLRLANECRRLLRAADPPALPPRLTPDARPRRARSGVLALLEDGERCP